VNFLDKFSEKAQISNFIKIRPVGAELFHAGGLTDMLKLVLALGNFTNALKTICNAISNMLIIILNLNICGLTMYRFKSLNIKK
jgi:hypothetical protein